LTISVGELKPFVFCVVFVVLDSYRQRLIYFAAGGTQMELSLHLLLHFMPRMYCGSIGLLSKMSEQLLAAVSIF
jgi:hypothetical protein